MSQKKKNAGKTDVRAYFAIAGYMTCSALMLLVNKITVNYLPAPSFVLLCQLVSSAFFTKTCGALGFIKVDNLNLRKVKKFWIVPMAFLGTIFANIKILQHANVETFIVFRASTPIMVSLLEWQFLERHLPSKQSWMCLVFILMGATSYVLNDKFFNVDAYWWVCVWYAVFCFDQVYIKHAVDSVDMTTWGRVYYTNLLASGPLILSFMFTGELDLLNNFEWTNEARISLFISCVCGTLIAYFAFLARERISAAYFTVVGNTCKVVTIVLNHFWWNLHATPAGLASLGVCLAAAAFYKQAPKRGVLPK